jgi:hypothetical protein
LSPHRARAFFANLWRSFRGNRGDNAIVSFELYPFHSRGVTARIGPGAQIVRQLEWEPIGELDHPPVFAFGAPWFSVAEELGLAPVTGELRLGRDDSWRVEPRSWPPHAGDVPH